MSLKTPVVFLVFNRPDCTARTFAEIRKARPRQLLVVSDGPRTGHPTDGKLCRAVREIIDEGVDWPCEVSREFSPNNLGCGRRVSSGLNWAFGKVEEAIIIEDDCLPDPSFFWYAEELLCRYKEDDSIMHIAGANLLQERIVFPSSYTVSRYGGIWGWATWRRAWINYDFKMLKWRKVREDKALISSFTETKAEAAIRIRSFDDIIERRIDTWDSQWVFAKLARSGFSIIPATNLVHNMGFDQSGTHTTGIVDPINIQNVIPLPMPLLHPPNLDRNLDYDRLYSKLLFKEVGWRDRLSGGVRRLERLLKRRNEQ